MNDVHHSKSGDEINLLFFLRIIRKYKKMIFYSTIAASLIAAIGSGFITKLYKSEATIMPIVASGSKGLGSVTSQLGGLSILGGISGGSTALQQFTNLLTSRTLARNVVENTQLAKIIHKNSWDFTNDRFKDGVNVEEIYDGLINTLTRGMVQIKSDKAKGMITVSAIFEDPKEAQKLATAYLEELQNLINNNAFTVAKKYRLFIEGQLLQNKRALLESGKELNRFYDISKVSSVESRVDVPLYLTPPGDDVMNLDIRLGNLERKKRELADKLEEIDVVKEVPQQVYLQYLTLRRDLLGQVNALLSQQYEMAKIEEAKEDLQFQVVDRAEKPLRKFEPNRKKIVMLTFILTFMLATGAALIRNYFKENDISVRDLF